VITQLTCKVTVRRLLVGIHYCTDGCHDANAAADAVCRRPLLLCKAERCGSVARKRLKTTALIYCHIPPLYVTGDSGQFDGYKCAYIAYLGKYDHVVRMIRRLDDRRRSGFCADNARSLSSCIDRCGLMSLCRKQGRLRCVTGACDSFHANSIYTVFRKRYPYPYGQYM